MIALQSSKLVAVTKIIDPSAERLSLTTFEVCSSKFEVCSSDISWPRVMSTSQNSTTRAGPSGGESRGVIHLSFFNSIIIVRTILDRLPTNQ